MRPPHRLIIVRQGETAIFQAIQQNLDRWPEGTRVIWDRRQYERRTTPRPVTVDRRHGERRVSPDSMWYTHGFIVVETQSPDESVADVV